MLVCINIVVTLPYPPVLYLVEMIKYDSFAKFDHNHTFLFTAVA